MITKPPVAQWEGAPIGTTMDGSQHHVIEFYSWLTGLSIVRTTTGFLLCFALVAAAQARDTLAAGRQRALEIGAAASAAAEAFDGNPIEGVIFVSENTCRAWSKTCTAQIVITAAFDELASLSPPDLIADVQGLECRSSSDEG